MSYVKVLFDENYTDAKYHKLYTYEDKTLQGLGLGDRVVVDAAGQEQHATVVRVGVTLDIPIYRVKPVRGVLRAHQYGRVEAAPYNLDHVREDMERMVRTIVQAEVRKQLRERAVKRARAVVRMGGDA